MNERLKELRKSLKLSMEKFGERIGVTKSSISMLESGKNEPSKQTIKLICTEFNVNEEWLVTGKGGIENMFNKTDTISKAYNHFGYIMEHSSPYKKAALTAMIEMIDCVPDDKWEYIVNTFQNTYTEVSNPKEEA